MVSLCGLALSSLFAINNKSVVHADTVDDNNQNSAISWDNDSDQTQGVQSEQTQKADDDQQNAAQSMQSRAETSNVESISVQRNTAVQSNAANARTVQDIKVANIDTAQPAVVKQSQANYSETLSNLGINANLGDLGVYDVSPDGVKSNIQSQVQSQLAIDDASLANFNMNKDASGNLTASFGVYSNRAKQQNWWTNVKVNNTVVPGIQWRTNEGVASDGNLHVASTGQPIVYSVGIHKLPGVVIHNPAGNKVNVHYVNSEGKDITDPVVKDTIVDASKAGSGSYSVPNGYSLNDPDGKYDVTAHAYDGSNNVKITGGSVQHIKFAANYDTSHLGTQVKTMHVKFVDQATGKSIADGKDDYDINLDDAKSDLYKVPKGYTANNVDYSVSSNNKLFLLHGESSLFLDSLDKCVSSDVFNAIKSEIVAGENQLEALGNHIVNGNGIQDNVRTVYLEYVRTYNTRGITDELKDYANIPDIQWLNTAPDNNVLLFIPAARNGSSTEIDVPIKLPDSMQAALQQLVATYGDRMSGYSPSDPFEKTLLISSLPVVNFSDAKNDVKEGTVIVPVHKTNSFTFSDNSGNVKSVNGNTVDVVLTKPQQIVNPDSNTFCHSQATRTIQINFPDGQVPDSYKGIVDKSGKLVQTVHFTRPATEDALTGNILWYGNWTSDNQDHNFIGFEARTLPRIPGYTLSIKPAQ